MRRVSRWHVQPKTVCAWVDQIHGTVNALFVYHFSVEGLSSGFFHIGM